MVLKPSQLSPLSALLFTEAVDEAGVPAGVFNMINGAGAALGDAFATHPLVDMVSLTGSTAVGGVVGAAAAPSIKRVSLELGGKSANIVFGDVNVEKVVRLRHARRHAQLRPDLQRAHAHARRRGDLRRGGRGRGSRRRGRRRRRPARPGDLHGSGRRAQAVRDGARLHPDRHRRGRAAGRRRARAAGRPRQGASSSGRPSSPT